MCIYEQQATFKADHTKPQQKPGKNRYLIIS